MNPTSQPQEHIHASDGSTANPSKLVCRKCGETYTYDTNLANSIRMKTPQANNTDSRTLAETLAVEMTNATLRERVEIATKFIQRGQTEAKLELGEHLKKYMISTSPFISKILQPELDRLKAQLSQSIEKEKKE
jgi:phenylacetate-coenzyme A ligase PaaK-like adenylate-forming protein